MSDTSSESAPAEGAHESGSGKHKTVGVSMGPELRQAAAERARALGLSFSRYVSLCLEAEIHGRPPQLVLEGLPGAEAPRREVDLAEAVSEGGDYGAAKAASIGFEDDIEDILGAEGLCYTRFAQVAHLRTDFLVQRTDPRTDAVRRIAVECKHTMRGRYTVTLGQAIILKSLPLLDGLVLCVPYRKNFDPHVLEAFGQQGIPVATPDTVAGVLERLLRGEDGLEPVV